MTLAHEMQPIQSQEVQLFKQYHLLQSETQDLE